MINRRPRPRPILEGEEAMSVLSARVSRRTSLAIAAGAIAASRAPKALAQGTPVQGGRLTWAYVLRPSSLDPNVWTGGNDTVIMRQIFDPLIWSPTPGEYIPGLATSWTVSQDGRVYRFELRRDVTFHDGTPFNAEAVKLVFDRIKNPEWRSLQAGAIGPYESSTVVDSHTVEIRFSRPWTAFLANLSSVALSPVSPTAVNRHGPQIAQNPVGTGPFIFERWQGNDIHLRRNPNYRWAPAMMAHSGVAHLEEIVVKEVPEAATRMNALRTGEVNFTHFPVLSQLEAIERGGFPVMRAPQPGFSWSFPMNITRPPTDDVRVRQAVIHGINRDQIVRAVLFGQARAAHGPLTEVTFGYDPAVKDMYRYDPRRAGELLDQAGWRMPAGGRIRERNGERLKLEMIMFDVGVNKQISELAQAMLQQLGAEVTLSVTNYPAFAARVTAADYNLSQMRWSALDPDTVIPTMFHSGNITGGGQFNRTRIAEPALDQMIGEAGASSDPAVRRRLYSEIQLRAMREAWIAPVYDDMWYWLRQQALQGVRLDVEGRPLFYNAWIARS
jgi:peptide/nickel transport system substrate-binding protein